MGASQAEVVKGDVEEGIMRRIPLGKLAALEDLTCPLQGVPTRVGVRHQVEGRRFFVRRTKSSIRAARTTQQQVAILIAARTLAA
jgi:hypothetical protein